MEVEEFTSSHSLPEPPVQAEFFQTQDLPTVSPVDPDPIQLEPEEEIEIPKTKEEIAQLSKLRTQINNWAREFPETYELIGVTQDEISDFTVEELESLLHDLDVTHNSMASFATMCSLVDVIVFGMERLGTAMGFKVDGFSKAVIKNPEYTKARAQIVIKRTAGYSFSPEMRMCFVFITAFKDCHEKNTAKEQKDKLVEDPELVAILQGSSSNSHS